MRGNDHKDFDESDVEVGPAGDLDLIKTIEEQHSPADVKDNDGIGGKGWKRKKIPQNIPSNFICFLKYIAHVQSRRSGFKRTLLLHSLKPYHQIHSQFQMLHA